MFGLTPYGRKDNAVSKRGDIWDLRSVFDDFFNDSFQMFGLGSQPIKADIRENEKEYIVDAEIPGVNKEDIKLDLRDDTLTISVEHNEQINEEKDNYVRKERRYGSFSRSFYVQNIKHDAVKAKYENGILSVVLPKQEGIKEDKHRIEIQ